MKQKKAKTTFSKSKRNQYSSPFRSENSAISSNMISIYLFTPPPPLPYRIQVHTYAIINKKFCNYIFDLDY